MKVYKFFDTDYDGQKDFDIAGTDYQEFLDTCFQYCASVAFRICIDQIDKNQVLRLLEPHRIAVTDNVKVAYEHQGSLASVKSESHIEYEIRHYALNLEVKDTLKQSVNSIFEWLTGWGFTNPDDPAFFRSDGTVFFMSSIHEGECTLIPCEHEDVSSIISCSNWIVSEESIRN